MALCFQERLRRLRVDRNRRQVLRFLRAGGGGIRAAEDESGDSEVPTMDPVEKIEEDESENERE